VHAQDKFKSEFLFIMLLQNHVSADQRISAIEKQLSDLQSDLNNIEQCRIEMGNDPACSFVMGYGEAVLSAGKAYLKQKLAELLSTQSKKAAE